MLCIVGAACKPMRPFSGKIKLRSSPRMRRSSSSMRCVFVSLQADVQRTPPGLGGSPRNPSTLGAPLADIQVPEAPSRMSVEGVRLLDGMQHAVGPFNHRLGERYNKKDLERVVRLSAQAGQA